MILNVAVEPAGKVGVSETVVVCSAVKVKGNGLVVTEVAGVDVKVTVVQLRPLTGGSKNDVPGAAAGPRLATVTV